MLLIIVPELDDIKLILSKTTYKFINKEYNLYKCSYQNKEFYISVVGYGKVNVSIHLEYVTNKYDISSIISIGTISKTCRSNVNILDIIVPSEVVQLEYNLLDCENDDVYIPCDKLNKAIITTINYTGYPYRLNPVRTTESFMVKKSELKITDYDLGVLGQISYKKKIPFSGIKVVTHCLCTGSLSQYKKYRKPAMIKCQKIILDYLLILPPAF